MKVSNHPELDVYIKEPVRKGWEYGGKSLEKMISFASGTFTGLVQ